MERWKVLESRRVKRPATFLRSLSSRNVQRNPRLLHVRDFAVYKCDLDVFIDIDLLGAEIDDLIGLSDRRSHLVGSLALFNLLRRSLLLRLSSASASSSSALLVAALLIIPITIDIALVVALIVGIAAVIDGEQSGDRIFHLRGIGAGQGSFGELENDVSFEESFGVGVVAGIAGNDAHDHLILLQIHGELGGIDFVVHLEELCGLRLAHFAHERTKALGYQGIGRMHRSVFILGGENALVGIRHAENAAFLDDEDGALL